MSWQIMRDAPKSERVLLYVPRRSFSEKPAVGVGYWAGSTWRLLVDENADPRNEAVDPACWQPVPCDPTSEQLAELRAVEEQRRAEFAEAEERQQANWLRTFLYGRESVTLAESCATALLRFATSFWLAKRPHAL